MAADSAGTDNNGDQLLSAQKLYRRLVGGEEMLIGAYGSMRAIQAARYNFDIPPIEIGQELEAWLSGPFVDTLRMTLDDAGCLGGDSEGEMLHGGLLIGFRGRLLSVMPDFAIAEDLRGYDAVGAGHAYAKGALALMKDRGLKEKDAARAVEVAAAHNAFVCGPIQTDQLYITSPES